MSVLKAKLTGDNFKGWRRYTALSCAHASTRPYDGAAIVQPAVSIAKISRVISAVHSDGRTAALAVKRFFNFETVVPCHYGTFDLLDQDPGAFVAAMAGHATNVAVLGIGEALVV